MINGALLGDFVKGPLRGDFGDEVERGIRLHRKIDAYSDADTELRLFRRALPTSLRRYSGILTDVVFDFYLSAHWAEFHHEDLSLFSRSVYRIIEDHRETFPGRARDFSQRLIDYDLLCQYGEWTTVDRVIRSIGARLRFDNPLRAGAATIEPHRKLAEAAFLHFYPRVQQYAADFRTAQANSQKNVRLY